MTAGRLLAACSVAALACAAPGPKADELLYYTDPDGRVVFTNTPSRADARPVPSLRGGPLPRGIALPATPYDRYIEAVARDNGVDPSLVKAVALVESGFNPGAVSRAGAQGIMQLMPATAARYGVSDARDPYQSLNAGARHLRDLLDEYGGNVTLALAAYNAGSGAVKKSGGVPAYRETRDYVKRVEATMGRSPRRGSGRVLAVRTEQVTMRVEADGSILLSN